MHILSYTNAQQMRHPSFSLHRIAAAAVFLKFPPPVTFSTSMYSAVPPPFTGSRSRGSGRGRRRYSDRTSVSGDSQFQSVHDSNSNFQRSNDFRSFNNNNNSNYRNLDAPLSSGGRGRGRRSFSDRPSATFVSGDSHFQSVHDYNSNFQRSNDFRSFNNNNCSNYRNFDAPANRCGRGGGRGGYDFRGGSPSFNRGRNQPPVPEGRVQRPKPADFRSWEFSKPPPPPYCEHFVVLSYNILADYLANSHRKLYFHIPRRFMSWEWRKRNILFELRLWSPDIMCFQEVDRFQDLEEDLRAHGYSGIWKMRTGNPIDGCAIFWRTTRFKLMYEESVEFNKYGLRDNVAQICVLESLAPNCDKDQLASSVSSEGPNRVVISNIHVLYNPRRGEIKLGQVRILLERAQAVSKTWDDAPVVLCGDFNCTPKSPLYNFISEQKLDISEVDRDKVSGQASAVIEPPPRLYGPQFREQSTGDLTSPTTVQNNSVDSKQCDSLAKEFDKECTSGNIPTTISFEEPPVVSSQNVLVNSSENNTELSDSSQNLEDTQDNLTCLNKDETRLANPTLQESIEVTMLSSTGEPKLTGNYEASDPNTSSALNHDIDEKFVGLSLNDVNEPLEDDEDLGEDAKSLSDSGDASTPHQGDLVPAYDPSLWTPMEIETATGHADCTILEHPLMLRSTYAEVVDLSGTRDSNGEPLVTSFNTCFMGTVDYIWRSEGLCTSKVLAPISKDAMQPSGGFPTKKWGSDHIALASELAFIKKRNEL